MGCDLYAGAPSAFAAHVTLPTVDPSTLAILTRIAADERGVALESPPARGELGAAWIDLFAGVGEAAAHRIGRRWLREVDPGAEGAPEALDAVAETVRAIADLCRAAKAGDLPVVAVPAGAL